MMESARVFLCTLFMAAVCTAGIAGTDRVQSPDAKWKTIKTVHYHIHYPANPKGDFEQFAMEVASKIEGIHEKVAEWVGYEEKGPTNVLIIDPIMEANGATIPNMRRPAVLLYKTQPEPESGIGHYDNWVDLLVTHELAHLHHLMRPQNGPKAGSLFGLLLYSSYGPITIKAPRLIVEGYATLIEGRITGSGRPHSAYRAAVIRQWAIQGRLPGYDVVSGSGGFRGGQMAYLLGSAYLEWLEKQNSDDPDILKKFWKQLTSKKKRSYSDSFKATFGLKPEDSYSRWRAEVTHDAIAFEQKAKASGLIREGEVVARFDTEISGLALSPDGSKLMARLLTNDRPGIRIWDLNAGPEPDKKSKRVKPEKADDPNEVEDRKPEFLEPKILTVLGKRNGVMPRRAWWTGDDQVTLEMRPPNHEGILTQNFLVADLKAKTVAPAKMPLSHASSEFTWKEIDGIWNIVRKLPNGSEQQITRVLSAAWQPAPTPDGKVLYYVQLTATGCEIRRLYLDQPEMETVRLPIPENIIIQDTIISPPNAPSLLPSPVGVTAKVDDYSVFGSHLMEVVNAYGYAVSPADNSLAIGFGGSDILGRLNWYAVGAIGAARGPRGGGIGIAYRGWRLAPSLQAFSSFEKPSAQKYEPLQGLDRERQGAELAFTWQQKGMTPISIKPFTAWETVKNIDSDIADTNRYLVGAAASFAKQWSRSDWGVSANATFQGAFGRSNTSSGIDEDSDWNISRLQAGLSLLTPAGPINITAEEGRLGGDYSILDAFRLGGQNTGLVPDSLEINRVQQPALPGYLQVGDRMRKLRASYGIVGHVYYERAAVWSSGQSSIDYQSVLGIELRADEAFDMFDPLNLLQGPIPKITIGVHRPLDGIMKERGNNRNIWTINISIVI